MYVAAHNHGQHWQGIWFHWQWASVLHSTGWAWWSCVLQSGTVTSQVMGHCTHLPNAWSTSAALFCCCQSDIIACHVVPPTHSCALDACFFFPSVSDGGSLQRQQLAPIMCGHLPQRLPVWAAQPNTVSIVLCTQCSLHCSKGLDNSSAVLAWHQPPSV